MTNWNLIAIGIFGLLTLGGCNVGSDDGQTSSSAASAQTTTTSQQAQSLDSTLSSSSNTATTASGPAQTVTYYLVLQGTNANGDRITNSIVFKKSVSASNASSVQLIWFEPNRNTEGSCTRDLNGYELKYGQQPNTYNTSLQFDLASRDMSCTTVGSNECGDVRECRYNLSL